MHDGSRVSYIGAYGALNPVSYDDQGTVLATGSNGTHVKWDNGLVTLVDNMDLSPIGKSSPGVESDLDDSLETSGLSSFTAQSIFNERGAEALLDALDESGQLSVYTEAAEDALEALTALTARSGWARKLDDESRAEMALMVARELLKRV